jgi:leader peptidase (prepilin peptidase)/N-methyltransferase
MTLTHAINLFEYTWNNSITFSVFIPFMMGAAFGSFLNVVVLRSVFYDPWSPDRDRSSPMATIQGRSYCPRCQSRIAFWNNIPALSWFLLNGQSACCKTPISPQYPFVEWTLGLAFLGLCHLTPFPDSLILFFITFNALGVALTLGRFKFVPMRLSLLLVISTVPVLL